MDELSRQQYAYIESLLADGRNWAVPGGYTIVDPYLLVFYQWGQRIGLEMRALCPAWTRLAERLLARPAVRRVLADEGRSSEPGSSGSGCLDIPLAVRLPAGRPAAALDRAGNDDHPNEVTAPAPVRHLEDAGGLHYADSAAERCRATPSAAR